MEIVEEVKLPFTWKHFGGTILPVAGGATLSLVALPRLTQPLAKYLPAKWVAASGNAIMGFGVLAANAVTVKNPGVRLAGFTCLSIGLINVLQAVGILGPTYVVTIKPAGSSEKKGGSSGGSGQQSPQQQQQPSQQVSGSSIRGFG